MGNEDIRVILTASPIEYRLINKHMCLSTMCPIHPQSLEEPIIRLLRLQSVTEVNKVYSSMYFIKQFTLNMGWWMGTSSLLEQGL